MAVLPHRISQLHGKPLPPTARLLLIRHGESAWNLEQRFTGWADVGLTATGVGQMQELGRCLRQEGVVIDAVFSSALRRCKESASALLHAAGQPQTQPVFDWRLNERHYGALTGLSKSAAVAEHGAAAVHAWRRSYREVPPPLTTAELPDAAIWQHGDSTMALPRSESLEHTVLRVTEVWVQSIQPMLRTAGTVAVVGHGNSLRGLIMQLEGLNEADVATLEVANGELRMYALPSGARPRITRLWRPNTGVASHLL
jgi:2,3-bisphosphoglycerate-dependent phosphoglycerate mutase